MEVCSHNVFDPYTVLLKINGTECNLDCVYCSEIKKNHKSSMTLEHVTQIFAQLPRQTEIILHGGEPMIVQPALLERIFELHKEFGYERKISVQTNGVISRETLDILISNIERCNIGISLDGPGECNNFRRGKGGAAVLDTVIGTLHSLQENDVAVKCIATINAVSVQRPKELLTFFLGFPNVKQLRLNPCYDVIDGRLADYAIRPARFSKFLQEVFHTWLKEGIYRRLRIDPLQAIIEDITRGKSTEAVERINCGKFVSIYADGMCTICDAFGDEVFEVDDYGAIFEKVSELLAKKGVCRCYNCQKILECGGGCPAIESRFEKDKGLQKEYCHCRCEINEMIRNTVSNIIQNG